MSAIQLSDAAKTRHNIEHDRLLKGHKIVVEGLYLARAPKRDVAGAAEKKSVKYREEFILEPHEHRAHGQGALGHILGDEKLAKRLSEKDKDFRAVKTHVVSAHENIWESDEEYQARKKAEADKAQATK